MAGKTKEVAVHEEAGALVVMDFEQDAGVGFAEVTQEDMQTPFLQLLQKGSPQVDDDNDAQPTIPGAKSGMFMNSVTQELYENVNLIPVHYRRTFTKWHKREEGGGFLGEVSPDDPIIHTTERDEKNRDITPDGLQLVDTRTYCVLHVQDNGNLVPMIMTFSSTQTKKSKRWLTVMEGIRFPGKNGPFNPPMFSHIYHVTSVPESNAQGNWKGYNIAIGDKVTDVRMYEAAKRLRDIVQAGAVKTAGDPVKGEDVPF